MTMLTQIALVAAVTLLVGCGKDEGKGGAAAATDTVSVSDTGAGGDSGGETRAGDDSGADADVDASGADGGAPSACAGAEVPGAPGCAEEARYLKDLKAIALPRPPGSEHHAVVRKLIEDRLKAHGYDVSHQDYGKGINLFGQRTGSKAPDELVIIGGHYDGTFGCPGADDNATAVAGSLEIARLLADHKPERTLMFVFWDEEERGLIGSRRQAMALATAGKKVVAVFDLEMIGYTNKTKGSQQVPTGFDLVFPEVGSYLAQFGPVGDFITLVYDPASQPAVDLFRKAAKALDLPAINVNLESFHLTASAFSDLRRSDHASFWSLGYPGIMLSDTANFRNTHYHCTGGEDTVDRLDHAFSTKVIQATAFAAHGLLAAGSSKAHPAGTPICNVKAAAGAAGSCPKGEKCTFASDGAGIVPKCVPPVGAKGASEICTRTDNKAGFDDCAPGLFCTAHGLPSATPLVRKCRPLCLAGSDCGKGEVCSLFGLHKVGSWPDWPFGGVCLPSCDPFTQGACPEGTQCSRAMVGADDLKSFWMCTAVGSVQTGEPCDAFSFASCAPGNVCEFGDKGEKTTCRAICDSAHLCAGGKACLPDVSAGSGAPGYCSQ